MDEKPTVQMDAYGEEKARGGAADSPPTVPIDDLFQEPGWPPAGGEQTPPRFGPPPPRDVPSDPSGKTVIMGPETTASLLAWLAVVQGPGATRGRVFTLERETVIGRKSGQVVLSNDAYVSGQHAKIRLEASDAGEKKQSFVLYDLVSANGTFAGERGDYRDNRVHRHHLKDGDFILVGETTLVFKQVELGDRP